MPKFGFDERVARALVTAAEASLRQAFLAAIRDVAGAAVEADVVSALGTGNVNAVMTALRLDTFGDALRRRFAAEFNRIAVETAAQVAPYVDPELAVPAPVVEAFLAEHAGTLIKNLSTEATEAVRTALTQGFRSGLPTVEIARLVRGHIGLLPRYTNAVQLYTQRLMEDGLPLQQAMARGLAYQRQLLQHRAMTIARSEARYAMTAGQRAAFTEAKTQGLFTGGRLVWMTATDELVCETCLAMNGKSVPLSGEFKIPASDQEEEEYFGADGPPAHPNCRCDIVLELDQPVTKMAQNQPRVPAGSERGGEWVSTTGGGGGPVEPAPKPKPKPRSGSRWKLKPKKPPLVANPGGGPTDPAGGAGPLDTRLSYGANRHRATKEAVDQIVDWGDLPVNFQTMIRSQIDRLPADHLRGLKRVQFQPYGSDLEGISTTNRSALGVYRTVEASAYMTGDRFMRKIAVEDDVVIHEIGHHVHLRLMTGTGGNRWRELSNGGANCRISQYGKTNEREHFADAYRAFTQPRASRRLQKEEPEVYAFMRDVFSGDRTKLLGEIDYPAIESVEKYHPMQPRVPRGRRDGGEWTSDPGLGGGPGWKERAEGVATSVATGLRNLGASIEEGKKPKAPPAKPKAPPKKKATGVDAEPSTGTLDPNLHDGVNRHRASAASRRAMLGDLPSDVSEKHAAELDAQLSMLPETHLRNIDIRVLPLGKAIPGGTSRSVLLGIYSRNRVTLTGEENYRDAAVSYYRTLIHEVGHHVHEGRLAKTAQFRWSSMSSGGRMCRISKYGRTNDREHFAEAYEHFAAGGRKRAKLKRLEPETYRFMVDVFSKPGLFRNAPEWELAEPVGKAFNPSQPRVPAGDSRGGQFAAGGGSGRRGGGDFSAEEVAAAKAKMRTVPVSRSGGGALKPEQQERVHRALELVAEEFPQLAGLVGFKRHGRTLGVEVGGITHGNARGQYDSETNTIHVRQQFVRASRNEDRYERDAADAHLAGLLAHELTHTAEVVFSGLGRSLTQYRHANRDFDPGPVGTDVEVASWRRLRAAARELTKAFRSLTLEDFLKAFDPSQPRYAAGSPKGGQFAPATGGGGSPGDAKDPDEALAAQVRAARVTRLRQQVDSTNPKQAEAAERLADVLEPDDPMSGMLVRDLVDVPPTHLDGLGSSRMERQGVRLVTADPTGAIIGEVFGYYRPSTAEIVLSGGNNIAVMGGRVVLHEVGHHVHERKLTPTAAAEWERLSDNGNRALISSYARTSRGEHFAEAYLHYVAGERKRQRLRNMEPEAYRFMANLCRKGTKQLLPDGTVGAVDPERWGTRNEVEKAYHPMQPRVPAGDSRGGQWTSDPGFGGGAGWKERAQAAVESVAGGLRGLGERLGGGGGGGGVPAGDEPWLAGVVARSEVHTNARGEEVRVLECKRGTSSRRVPLEDYVRVRRDLHATLGDNLKVWSEGPAADAHLMDLAEVPRPILRAMVTTHLQTFKHYRAVDPNAPPHELRIEQVVDRKPLTIHVTNDWGVDKVPPNAELRDMAGPADPRAGDTRSSWSDVGAVYSPREHAVTLSDGYGSSSNVAAHEVGHAVATLRPRRSDGTEDIDAPRLSDSPLWESIATTQQKRIIEHAQTPGNPAKYEGEGREWQAPYFLRYDHTTNTAGRDGRDEGFAEAFADYVVHNGDRARATGRPTVVDGWGRNVVNYIDRAVMEKTFGLPMPKMPQLPDGIDPVGAFETPFRRQPWHEQWGT